MEIEKGLSALIKMLRSGAALPDSLEEKWRLYRSLVNMRMPGAVDEAFIDLQDRVLLAIRAERGVVQADAPPSAPLDRRLALWRGDITTLAVDAIVNAANEQLLGCFIPCHHCIDNAIHTYAGVQLREACHRLLKAQGHVEPVGNAKITPGFNLPCEYVLHTVGPMIDGVPTREECAQLAACYRRCLELASENEVSTLAFCCISTGVYRFPKSEAAQIAVNSVLSYLNTQATTIRKVIFNVYEERDDSIYRKLLGFTSEVEACVH